MIANIDIENFRCFEKTKIEGFQRINLITGKNNVGKTALLEAIYWGLEAKYNSDLNTRQSSNQALNVQSLFLNGDIKRQISISLNISADIFYSFKTTVKYYGEDKISINYVDSIHGIRQTFSAKLIFDKNLQFPEMPDLAQAFDALAINGFSRIIEESLQKIDPTIAEIRTFSKFPRVLFLRKKNEDKYLPINYFGDAIQKVARYIINILEMKTSQKPNKFLLVDEIENGLHYAAQEEFWQMLFTLCIDYDIQLFATTHSLEMIRAFEKIASKYENEAAYFEMARHPKTDRIIGLKHDMDGLEYALETNTKIRGEV
jgi:predicted ATP-dependent endonuclease of OLD family